MSLITRFLIVAVTLLLLKLGLPVLLQMITWSVFATGTLYLALGLYNCECHRCQNWKDF